MLAAGRNGRIVQAQARSNCLHKIQPTVGDEVPGVEVSSGEDGVEEVEGDSQGQEGPKVPGVGDTVQQRDGAHGPVTAEGGGAEEQAHVDGDKVGVGEEARQGERQAGGIVKPGEDWEGGALEVHPGQEKNHQGAKQTEERWKGGHQPASKL